MALGERRRGRFHADGIFGGRERERREYFGDTLYQVVEGMADVVLPDRRVAVAAGEAFMVPAHIPHAVEGYEGSAFKLLQLTIPEERS